MGKRFNLAPLPQCAAAYIRVSTPEQAGRYKGWESIRIVQAVLSSEPEDVTKDEKTSVRSQIKDAIAKAAEKGLPIANEHIYIDQFSGEDDLWLRPEYTRMLAAAKRGEFSTVVTLVIDRVARDEDLQTFWYYDLTRAGCNILLVAEDSRLSEDTPEGALMRRMMAFAARIENKARRRKALSAKRERAKLGIPLMGNRPKYGWQWTADKLRFTIDPVTSAVMLRMAQEVIQGKTLRAIAADLTADGISTPTGRSREWDPSTIRNLLKDPAYAGEHEAFKTKAEKLGPRERPHYKHSTRQVLSEEGQRIKIPTSSIPPIFTPELAEAVYARLQRNKELSPRRLRNPEDTLLHGIARCGFCASHPALSANRRPAHARRDGTIPIAYYCNAQRKLRDLDCQCAAIISRKLDDLVWAKIVGVLKNPDIIRQEVERINQEEVPGQSTLDAIDERIADVGKQTQRQIKLMNSAEDEDTQGKIEAEVKRLSEERKSLQARRLRAEAHFRDAQARREGLSNLLQWTAQTSQRIDAMTWAEKRSVLITLDVTVLLFRPDHEPHIKLSMNLPISGAISFGSEADENGAFSVAMPVTMIQHDIYHAGEINHLRALHQGNDEWEE
jgi:DNA invertase Pin-like site-specific DNA recombinase